MHRGTYNVGMKNTTLRIIFPQLSKKEAMFKEADPTGINNPTIELESNCGNYKMTIRRGDCVDSTNLYDKDGNNIEIEIG